VSALLNSANSSNAFQLQFFQGLFADNSANAESSAARSRLNVSFSTAYQWPFHCSMKIEKNADGQKRRTTPKDSHNNTHIGEE